MYTLKIWFCGRWKDGIKTYATYNDAISRIKKLDDVGIKAKLVKKV